MTAPLVLPLRYSPFLRCAIVALHALPLVVLIGEGVPGWVRITVCVCTVMSALWSYRVARRLAAARLTFIDDRSCELRIGDTKTEFVELLDASAVIGPLAVIVWHSPETGGVTRCAVWCDGLSPEQWRRLRIKLRWLTSA